MYGNCYLIKTLDWFKIIWSAIQFTQVSYNIKWFVQYVCEKKSVQKPGPWWDGAAHRSRRTGLGYCGFRDRMEAWQREKRAEMKGGDSGDTKVAKTRACTAGQTMMPFTETAHFKRRVQFWTCQIWRALETSEVLCQRGRWALDLEFSEEAGAADRNTCACV